MLTRLLTYTLTSVASSVGITVIILTTCSISLTNSQLRCSNVTFNLNYKNLKIDLLKKVDGKAELPKQGINIGAGQ